VINVRSIPGQAGARGVAAGLVSFALLAAFALPAVAASKPKPPPPRYHFGGVPWLVPADTAIAQITERGYPEVPAARDKDKFVCRGKMFEHEVLATGHLDEQHRLVRWVVLIGSRGEDFDYPDMRRVFNEVTRETQARYGAPRTVTEKYRFPYERGDGREDAALRDRKATIRWVWASKSGDRLTVEMDHTAAVVLTYEAPEWAVIEARLRAKKASDL
jgi:hypothetical protein